MFLLVWLVALAIVYTNSRLVLVLGLTVGGICCWLWSHVDTSWAGNSFELVELLMSAALACSYVGLVSSIVLEGLEAGALTSAANAATLSGFMHFVRIFGGQVGVAIMTRFLSVREKFHSNILGLHLQTGGWYTNHRLKLLTLGMLPHSTGLEEAQHRAAAILGLQVRAQAYTLATSDGFILIIWVIFGYLLLLPWMKPNKIGYIELNKMK
jgi:DHA2 family multidrug resistance protein